MSRQHILAAVALVVFVLVITTGSASACPSCYGAPDSPMTEGMNMAIMSLLGVTGGVLAAFVGFFVYLRRRAQQLQRMFGQRLN